MSRAGACCRSRISPFRSGKALDDPINPASLDRSSKRPPAVERVDVQEDALEVRIKPMESSRWTVELGRAVRQLGEPGLVAAQHHRQSRSARHRINETRCLGQGFTGLSLVERILGDTTSRCGASCSSARSPSKLRSGAAACRARG